MREITDSSEYDLLEGTPGPGEWLLCHADGLILAHHDSRGRTGSGRAGAEMVIGTKEEIDGEIRRLGLREPGAD